MNISNFPLYSLIIIISSSSLLCIMAFRRLKIFIINLWTIEEVCMLTFYALVDTGRGLQGKMTVNLSAYFEWRFVIVYEMWCFCTWRCYLVGKIEGAILCYFSFNWFFRIMVEWEKYYKAFAFPWRINTIYVFAFMGFFFICWRDKKKTKIIS